MVKANKSKAHRDALLAVRRATKRLKALNGQPLQTSAVSQQQDPAQRQEMEAAQVELGRATASLEAIRGVEFAAAAAQTAIRMAAEAQQLEPVFGIRECGNLKTSEVFGR